MHLTGKNYSRFEQMWIPRGAWKVRKLDMATIEEADTKAYGVRKW
jgi:hypothetical protein